MTDSQSPLTNAENLEARFDAGEEVLDFFDVTTARLAAPRGAREEIAGPIGVGAPDPGVESNDRATLPGAS